MNRQEAELIVSRNRENIIVEAARRRLLNFAKFVNPKLDVTRFHYVYYEVLDRFAHGKIKKLIVSVPPQTGKALKINELVLTTEGWKEHGALKVGDYVFGEDGKPKMVKWNSGAYLHATQKITFADGFEMIAAPEHEWVVYADHDDHKGRQREIVETQKIFARRNRRSPAIQADAILEMPTRELPINPYLLGVWLGDGNSRDKWIACGKEKFENVKQYIKEHKPTKGAEMVHLEGLETTELRKLGVLQNKHIPMQYILASREDRLRLLQGLMDTDGCVDKRGRCEFCQKEGQLAEDAYVLIRSLGYKATKRRNAAKLYGKDCGIRVRITFSPDRGDKVFTIPHKQIRVDNKPTEDRDDKRKFFITKVEDAEPQLVNCIEVEGGIYLAGRQLVPTHNSEGSSRNLPAFMLGLNPDLKICIGSYSATIARDFNRDVQRIIDTEEYAKVFPETRLNGSNVVTITSSYLRNSDVFECVGHKGGLRVVGRGGSLTSKTVDISILDDVYKDFAEGNSPVIREAAWRWYTAVVRTRLHNESQELIVFTRWHEDDLIGRIEKSGEKIKDVKCWADLENVPATTWLRINFEALKEGEPTELDNREPGEALWEARHSRAKLEDQRRLDPTGFQCLFQGNPSSAEGRLFSAFKTYVNKEDYGTLVRIGCYVDVADEGDDYLAGATYEIRVSPNQFFNEKTQRFEPIIYALITDIEYTDANTDVTTITIPDMINRNGCQRAWIESNNGGSQFEKVVKRKVRCQTIPFYQSQNKESRIITASSMVNATIIFPVGWEHRWPKAYEDITAFLRYFKGNAHDDIADMLTGIYEKEVADGNIRPYLAESRGVRVR